MKTPIALAAIDDFGIAGNQRDAGLVARLAHRCDDALQILERKPLFKNKRRGEEQRRRAADGQVIDCAVHRKLADVARRGKTADERQTNRW